MDKKTTLRKTYHKLGVKFETTKGRPITTLKTTKEKNQPLYSSSDYIEVKFRAWDKLKKELVSIELWDFKQKCSYCRNSNGKGWYTPNCNLEFIQFTGLLDKNGKEIWGGDIFDCIYKFDGCNEHKLEVVWHNDSASFRLKNHGKCHQPYVEKRVADMERMEVIGNIYENPELSIVIT